VDGGRVVAVITPISNLHVNYPNNKFFFGQELPKGVTNAQLFMDHLQDQKLVRWRVKNDPTIYEMPFEQTDEGVTAALVAMKLTC
jgi:hypothetical protein